MRHTDGKRIYAIGDIHGCLDDLNRVMGDIQDDLAARPHPDPLVVFLGDYVDRGPDSRGVIAKLDALRTEALPTVFLRGNHDVCLLTYLQDPEALATPNLHWLDPPMGGVQTLASYGVADAQLGHVTHKAFCDALPAAHVQFLKQTRLTHQVGSYLFVHAGIRPGVPLDQQDPQDLIWIRGEFLHHTEPHSHIVVHGHTPTDRMENHGNRIGIDTGAVFGRYLSCLVLEDEAQWQLNGPLRTPLEVISAPRAGH
ncbi:metallophosphoesterase family protein [Halovulum sp. GXIMD14793]